MSEILNCRFLADPVGFTATYPLVIVTMPGHTPLKDKGSHQSVRSDSRVAYWDISWDDDAQVFAVTLSSDPGEATLPGYWLPWTLNRTNKITLHDKRPTAIDGPPRAFFTASLTGCSLFIQGNPYTPTVYHTNARDSTLENTPSEPLRMAHRAALQEARLQRVPAPKRGGKLKSVVHARDYMNEAHPDADTRFAQRHEALGINPDDIVMKQESATLFGVGGGALPWSFYLHRHYRVVTSRPAPLRKVVHAPLGTDKIQHGGLGKPVQPAFNGGVELGALGRSLHWHVEQAMVAYGKRWHFNQSKQTSTALQQLQAAAKKGYLALLSVVHYYLGLDSAPYLGLGEPLKLTSEFYDDLNSQYRAWLG
ncbi:hypothetical protein ACN47A_01260 [Myxococcus fulvus]|uniref:hypothetical protein n=1 Tax=Myxococcus fulvus TaxID=33 RepID=UPI003B9D8B9F